MTDQNNWTEFMRFVPGFDFLKNLAPPTVGGTAAGPASTASGAFQQWLAPTMDEGEIQKRIDELKVVQFWLEQNSRALAASIHALEVQKGTVATLKSMNAGMQQMSQSFADTMAHSAQRSASAFEQDFGAAAATAAPATAAGAGAAQSGADNKTGAAPRVPDVPLVQAQAALWWTALTEQFQTIASKAMEDIGSNVAAMQQEPFAGRAGAADSNGEAATPAGADAAGSQAATSAAGASPKPRSAAAAAKSSSKSKPTPK